MTSMTDEAAHTPTGPLDPVAAAIASYFATDPVWQAVTKVPVAQTRAAVRAATPVTGLPPIDHVEDFSVPVAGGEIALRLYRPGPDPQALIVWAHGGGFALGSLDELDNFARALAAETRCAIVSVEYRLAPEHIFPTAVEDMLAAALWVDAHRAELAGREVPILLGGDSAGANLATVVTRKLHATGQLAVAANILAYPNTDTPAAPSLRDFDAPFLGVEDVLFFLGQYVPDPVSHRHPDFAPILADDLANLPPTLLITAEHDIVTGQAQAYARRLADYGVAVTTSQYPGMIHGFLTIDAFFPGAAGAAMHEISDFVATVTQQEGARA